MIRYLSSYAESVMEVFIEYDASDYKTFQKYCFKETLKKHLNYRISLKRKTGYG